MAANIQAPVTPRRVAIVDDELGPARFSQLDEAVRHTLSDPTSPELEAIWHLAAAQSVVPAWDSLTPAEIQQRVESEHFVNEVVLRPEFLPQFPETFRNQLAPMLDLRARVANLKQAVEMAFPQPEFVVQTFSHRPTPSTDLLAFNFLIMDLVMDDSDPITSVSTYLKTLSSAAGDLQRIPPILLISQRTDHLNERRLSFRTSGEISAAGLSIFSKQTIAHNGADGLKLLWDQMQQQAEAAHQMRVLCRAWNQALDTARQITAETLWNLDAAALQQVYQTARADNDPFEEHLHEIVSREHLWHLEREPQLRTAIGALGGVYLKSYGTDGTAKKLDYRYTAHATADMLTLRRVEHHFAWSGIDTAGDLTAADTTDLNRLLPLGAVLVPFDYATREHREVFVHLTQECDLNKRDLVKRDSSLFFARAMVVKPGTPAERGLRTVKAFMFNDTDMDLLVDPAQLIAMPVNRFLRWRRRLRIAGRVRRDIARQLLQASTNNATRVAAFTTTGAHQAHARVCVRFGPAPVRDFWYGVDGEGQSYGDARSVVVSTFAIDEKERMIHFLDDESFNLTLWMKQHLTAQNLGNLMPNMRAVCDQLRLGIELRENKALGELRYSAYDATEERIGNSFASVNVGAGSARIIIAVDVQ